jgi:adenylosuccinate lyase
MGCYEGKLDFVTELKRDDELAKYLSHDEIAKLTSDDHYFAHVDTIFARVFPGE